MATAQVTDLDATVEAQSGPDAPAQRAPLRALLPSGSRGRFTSLFAAGVLLASFAVYGFTGHALLGAVLCPLLVILAAIDLEHRLLPNDLVLPGVLATGLIVAAANPGGFLGHLAAGTALAAFFLVFAVATKGGLGMGDVKLGFLLGLALGSAVAAAAMIALLGLMLVALLILARRGLEARRTAIPFGPLLALGGILAYFLG